MLLSAPTEVTEMILSLLDLPSLAKTSQTCHRLRHLSIPPLYRTVTITSWTHLTNFFVPSSLPKLSSSLALERATARRADLDSIHHLVLDLPYDALGSCSSIPKLLSLKSRPLHLDSLRISYQATLQPVAQLLKSLNPRELYIHQKGQPYLGLYVEWGSFLALGSQVWSRAESLSFSARLAIELAGFGSRTVASSPFRNVTNATLFIPPAGASSILPLVERFVSFLPRAKSLRIVVRDERWRKEVGNFVEKAYGGNRWFRSAVVEVGAGVRFDLTSRREVWPGDEVTGREVYERDYVH